MTLILGAAGTAVLGAGTAWAGPAPGSALPAGWQLTSTGSGSVLTWHSARRIAPGDAMIEFYAGDRLLGRPVATDNQHTFRLAVPGDADLADLQVRAAGRRLDQQREPGTATVAPALVTPNTLPANPVDPGLPGPYSTITGEYTLSDVTLPDYPQPVEMKAVVVAPQGTSGSRPLVLFLHGRHDTCYTSTSALIVWPCPTGYLPIPSYRGYLPMQELLASQGYVTVSISANGINGQDGDLTAPADGGAQARSSLVRLHLAHWADWAGAGRSSAPQIVQDAPVADMTQVMLVGHSRGGEGVNRAAVDSITPPPSTQDGYQGSVTWQIKGLAQIGPTSLGQDPAADVPSMTILPGCDGDISDLEGEMYVDGTRGVSHGYALHSAVYISGANHNFFNTEWTPAQATATSAAFDDYIGHDPYCHSGSTSRLTYQQEQTAGSTYIAAAAQLFLGGDDDVRPLLDGSGFRAPSADPAQVLTHAVGGNRVPLLVPDGTTTATGTGARLCLEVPASTSDPDRCLVNQGFAEAPDFVPFGPVRPEADRYAADLAWSQSGGTASFQPAAPVSLSGSQSLTLRVIIPETTTGTSVQVRLTDTSAHQVTLGQFTLDGLPKPTFTTANFAQEVRLALPASGLDLSHIASLDLVPQSASGEVVLLDAWGWNPGTPAPQPAALPRVDLGELTVDEGDSGTTTYHIPVQVSGTVSGTAQVRVFVVDPVTGTPTDQLVSVPSGSTSFDIPIAVTGDAVAGDDRTYIAGVKAVTGIEVGDAFGALTVHDDD